jgi:hypothetical protein
MSFALNAYAQRRRRHSALTSVFVDLFSFVRKSLFFRIFSCVYEK